MENNRPFTVVLLYPEYATDDFGGDVYINCAHAGSAQEAVKEVQYQAHMAQVDCGIDPNDFRMVAVFEGDVPLALNAQDGS